MLFNADWRDVAAHDGSGSSSSRLGRARTHARSACAWRRAESRRAWVGGWRGGARCRVRAAAACVPAYVGTHEVGGVVVTHTPRQPQQQPRRSASCLVLPARGGGEPTTGLPRRVNRAPRCRNLRLHPPTRLKRTLLYTFTRPPTNTQTSLLEHTQPPTHPAIPTHNPIQQQHQQQRCNPAWVRGRIVSVRHGGRRRAASVNRSSGAFGAGPSGSLSPAPDGAAPSGRDDRSGGRSGGRRRGGSDGGWGAAATIAAGAAAAEEQDAGHHHHRLSGRGQGETRVRLRLRGNRCVCSAVVRFAAAVALLDVWRVPRSQRNWVLDRCRRRC